MYFEIILIALLVVSLQQLRILTLRDELTQWKETCLLNQRERSQ